MLFRRTGRTGLVVAVVVAVLGALTVPAVGRVPDLKTYTLHVEGTGGAAPDVYAGDADAEISLTLTNTSSNQSIGSANITLPDVLQHVDDNGDAKGQVIELRSLGLAPGASYPLNLKANVRTCAEDALDPVMVEVKQSNDFLGTGNDFFLDGEDSDLHVDTDGPCLLAFADHPTDAERNTPITAAPYDPAGPLVTVEVLDAGGTGRAHHATPAVTLSADPEVLLGGIASTTAVDGLATFGRDLTIGISTSDYVLVATANDPSFEDARSDEFDIVDDHVNCAAEAPCEPATSERDGQTVKASFALFQTGAQETDLVVSLGAGDVPAFSCAGHAPGGQHVAQFEFTGDEGSKRAGTVTLIIPNATRPLHTYEVCWAAPYDFVMDGGQRTEPDEELVKPGTGQSLHVGLLPDCARRGEPARPCVSGRSFDRRASAATIVVETTGEDPWARS